MDRGGYGRIVETYPRRCVFFGTVNESGYLRDPTGGRRYWPLEVLAPIDLDRISADRDQLWAEANMMQARGDSHVLPETLWPEAGKRQAEQTTNDPWADKLRDYLEQREEDWADYQLGEAADLEPLPPTGYTVRSYSRRLASRRNSNPRTGRKGSGRRWRPR